MRRRNAPFFISGLFAAALLSAAAPALANDPAAAEALFRAGKGLMDNKKYDEACPKFEASYKLDPAIGTMLNLADCYEKQGRLARAWAAWGDAAEQAKKEGDKPRQDLASRRQKELDPRLPKLTVHVKGSVEGLAVYRDDVKLEPATFDVPLPVDPGAHKVTLRRGDSVLEEQAVESKEKGSDEITLDATKVPPPPPPQNNGPIMPNPGPNGGFVGYGPQQPVEMERRSTGLMVTGIVVSSIGGLVMLGGAFATLITYGIDANQDAKRSSLGWLAVGTVATAGGITMAVIGSKKVPRKVEANLLLGPSFVGVSGQF